MTWTIVEDGLPEDDGSPVLIWCAEYDECVRFGMLVFQDWHESFKRCGFGLENKPLFKEVRKCSQQ